MRTFVRTLRGEVLQLRKWPAVWCLAAAMPVYMLVANYLLYYLMALTVSPAQGGFFGSSAYGVTYPVAVTAPGQLVQVVGEFGYNAFGPVLALVLGALVIGTGIERGTSRSAALTGAGWLRVLLAQVLAVCAVLVLSVIATYAVSAGSSELAHLAIGSPVPSTIYSFQPAGQIAHAIWSAALISVSYGMVGCALAAITQSSGAAIILGLLGIYGLENFLGTLAATIPAANRVELYDPENSVFTLTAMFGQPGGGGAELSNTPTAAAQTLGAWALGSALVCLAVGSVWTRRTSSRPRSRRLSASAYARLASPRMLGSRRGSVQTEGTQTASPRRAPENPPANHWTGVARALMTARSELFVLLRWPTVRALLLCAVLYPWLSLYVEKFFGYWLTSPGDRVSYFASWLSAREILPLLLSNLDIGNYLTGTVPMLLIGAWAGGSIWTSGQLRTSLTQRPQRSEHALGQCLALVLLTIGTAILTFAVAALSVKLVALLLPHLAAIHTGGRYGTFPSITQIIDALGAYALATTAYALIGLALGTTLRSPGTALGAALLWVIGVEIPLETMLRPQLHGALLRIADALPDAGVTRLTNISGPLAGYGYPGQGPTVSVSTAILQLFGWTAIAIIITTWLISRSEHA